MYEGTYKLSLGNCTRWVGHIVTGFFEKPTKANDMGRKFRSKVKVQNHSENILWVKFGEIT